MRIEVNPKSDRRRKRRISAIHKRREQLRLIDFGGCCPYGFTDHTAKDGTRYVVRARRSSKMPQYWKKRANRLFRHGRNCGSGKSGYKRVLDLAWELW